MSAAFACSGPHTQELIRNSVIVSQVALGLQIFMSVAMGVLRYAVRVGPGHPAIGALLVAINPVWWMDAGAGDCGAGMLMGSILMSGVTAALLLWQRNVWQRNK